ncbi:MAG TPA: NAD(P)H-dependent oxidoreductase [Solirubrobacteraceae bacterium]|jgi:chromate reductase
MRVLGICGSLRKESWTRKALEAARNLVPPDAEIELYDDLRSLPPYDEDEDRLPAHPAVRRLRDAIAAADAVLVVTPEYNGSVPGVLKNALDWASRPFPENCLRDKPVAAVAGSPSPFGAVWAQADLRRILGICRARVVDREVALAHLPERFAPDGSLEPDAAEPVRDLLAELVREAEHDQIAMQEAA